MEKPIILCGLGRMGSRVLDYLLATRRPVVIIDTVCKPDDPRLRGARLIVGDCRQREVLQAAGADEAGGVLILTNDDLINVTTALAVRSLNRDVRIVLRMFNQNLLARLGKAVSNVFALSTSMLTAPILAITALTGQALGTYRVDEQPEGLRQIVDITISPNSPLRGRTLSELMTRRNVVFLAHCGQHGKWRTLLEVHPETVLAAGDHLIVHGEPHELAPLLSSGERQDPPTRWANWMFRMGRAAWNTVLEMEKAVLICALVFFSVVALSTLVLKANVEGYTYAKALLQTVSVMATAAALPDEKYDVIRVYVSALRITGAVLLAAFTAFVTQYLLRAKLGGALEVRRIPESGHVVVCGLSTVGFRVVEELVRLKEPVVVIELDPTNRFVSTARRLGAAVMIGDASVIELLRQANVGTARAVVSATNNDMTNLEVALLVQELNPQCRMVLLLNDPQFAQMLRDAAGVALAVCVPALAAPAFLAGLFGDRVESVFFIDERLFAVIDLIIDEGDRFAGKTIRALAVDYHMLPVCLERTKATVPPPKSLLAGRLEPGDRLFCVVALDDVEPLLQRKPATAAFAVEVTAMPGTARDWLIGIARMKNGCSLEEADQLTSQVPFRLAGGLTRGEAEDLLAQLQRERITARICPHEELLSTTA